MVPFGGTQSVRALIPTLTCPGATASLIELSGSGETILPALQTVALSADGTYTFTGIRSLGVILKQNRFTKPYVVEINGCNTSFGRVLTAAKAQDITLGTSLVAFMVNTPNSSSVVQASPEKLEYLYESLKPFNTFADAYSALSSSTPLIMDFQEAFGVAPTVLEDASPKALAINVPGSMREHEVSALALTTSQWDTNYNYAYSWSIDGVEFATTANTTFTPKGNAQGNHVITVRWGQQDGSGALDPAKPLKTSSFPVVVENNVLPTPPPLSAASPSVNTPNVNLRIGTGALFANCDTFAKLALTEDVASPPLTPGEFNISCATAPTQAAPVLLQNGLGIHTMYLWTMDSAGVISVTPSTFVVNYSLITPVITIASPAANFPTQGTLTVSGTCESSSGDVTFSGNLSPSSSVTACVSGSYSRLLTLSAGDGAKTITASQTNEFNTTGSASVAVLKDSAPPTVLFASAALATTNTASISVTATFSEPVTGFDATKLVAANAAISGFTGSGSNYSFTLTPSGQGVFSVSLAANVAQDSAGNGNMAAPSFSRIFDSVAPTVVLSSAATSPTNLSDILVTATFSEAVSSFSLGSLQLSGATASNLSGSGASYNFHLLPSAQGAVSVIVKANQATDAGGNGNTISPGLNFTYDTISPTLSLATAVADPTNVTPIPVTATFSEPVSGFSLSDIAVTNGSAGSFSGSGASYTFNITPSANGLVSVSVAAGAAADAAGNASTVASLSRGFNNVQPSVILTSTRVSPSKLSPFPITAVFSNSVTGFSTAGITVTNGTAGAVSGSGTAYTFNVTPSGEGDVTIATNAGAAQDNVPNLSLASNSLLITFDTVAPTLALTAPAPSSFVNLANQASLPVSGTCSEEAATVGLTVGSVSGSAICSSGAFSATLDLQTLSDGSITLTANLSDAAGNAATPATRALTKDISVPTATLSGAPPATSNANVLNINVAGTSVSYYRYKLGAAASTDCTSATGYSVEVPIATHITDSIAALADDSVKLCVVARNAAGNYQTFASATTATWIRDTVVAPFSGLAISPLSPGNNTKPSVSGNTEGSSTVKLYGAASCGGSSLVTTTSAAGGSFTASPTASLGADGSYSLSVQTTDAAGNTLCSSTIPYTLDSTAPSVIISSTAPSFTNATPIPVSITFSESVTGFSLAGINVTNGTASGLTGGGASYNFTITPVSQGAITASISAGAATDAANNASQGSLTLTRTFDTLMPVLTLVAPIASANVNTSTITASGACESGLPISISGSGITGPASTTCTASAYSVPLTLTAGEGIKNFALTQTDAAGNTATVSNAITLDTIAPSFLFTSTSVQNQSTAGNFVTFSGSCESGISITVSGTDTNTISCSGSSWTYNTVSRNTDGPRAYTFTQTDAAGNATAINGSWFRDSVTPTISLTSLNSGGLFKGGVTQAITWTATDANLVTNPISIDYTINGGTTWLSIASGLSNSGSYTWTLPSVNSAAVKVRVLAKDAVNTGTATSAASFSIDSSAPVVTLTSLTSGALLKGGATQTIAWTATDANFGATPIQLAYSSNGGGTWTNIGAAIANTGTYTWTVPALDGTNFKVRVTATDGVAQASSDLSTSPFAIDSTAPAVSLTALTGGQTIAGNNAIRAITWTASDANFGSGPISLAYSANSGSTWNPIASGLANGGTYNWTVNVADATTYRIRVSAADSVGNAASSTSTADFTITSSAPALTQTNVASPAVTSGVATVTFGGACDLSASMGGGTSITVTGTDTATIPCNGSAPTGTWSYTTASQSADGNRNYTFAQTNLASVTSSIPATWIRDTVVPVVSAVSINNGDVYLRTTTAAVAVTATDAAYSTNLQVRLAAGTSTLPGASDVDCQAMYASSGWQNQTNPTTTFLVQVPDGDGYKKICAWAKDAAGNITVISPSTGSAGTNMNIIRYANASPPQITSLSVTNAANGSNTFASGDLVKISFVATDSLGLDNNPIKLEYTTNGSTFTTIESGYGAQSGNPTSYGADYFGFSAPSAGFFQVRISAKNVTGQTSAAVLSQAQNAGAWSIFAGTTDRGIGGTARSAVFQKNDGVRKKSFAFDPLNGDLYAFDDSNNGLMKIDAKTGIVSKFIGYGTTNLPDAGPLPATPLLGGLGGMVTFDSNRLMYVSKTSTGRTSLSAIIYQINLTTNQVRRYAGSAASTANDGSALYSNVWVNSGDFEFDESNTLYFTTSCQMGGTWNSGTLATRMLKMTQLAGGAPGAISVVAGDCTKGVPASGVVATATALTNLGDNLFTSLGVWNNGAVIYFADGSGSVYKILNGNIFATALSSIYSVSFEPKSQLLYTVNSSANAINSYIPAIGGASGEILSANIVAGGGTGNCLADGAPANATCMSFYGNIAFNQQGKPYFGVGSVNAGTRIGYVNSNSKVSIFAGTLPFLNGGTKDLSRGGFTGIYYKKSSEPNLVAYPSGLYFREKGGGVFGRIETNGTVTIIAGNQAGNTISLPANGTLIDQGISLGANIASNSRKLQFDSQGLPWFVTLFSNTNTVAHSLDSNGQFVRKQLGGATWDYAANGGAAASTYMNNYGGEQNLTLKGQTLLLFGRTNTTTLTATNPVLRVFNFATNIITELMGTGTTASADTTIPGSLAAKSFSSYCLNDNCATQFIENDPAITTDDYLFFSDGTSLKYITDPTNPANSLLTTVFTGSAGANINNFTISPDGTQVFYVAPNANMYCHPLNPAGNKSWCNDTTLGPPAGLVGIGKGPNQFTWKDSSTMLISNYNGLIYQYNVLQTP